MLFGGLFFFSSSSSFIGLSVGLPFSPLYTLLPFYTLFQS